MADSSRIVLITGANAGLGLEIVKALAQSEQAYTILVAGRSPDKVKTAIESVQKDYPQSKAKLEPLQIDVESDDSISKAASEVEKKYGRLDVLVNNAGAQHDHDPSLTRRQIFVKNWDVNVAGAHVLTESLAPLLAQSKNTPQLIFMTSGTASLKESEETDKWFNVPPPAGFPKPPPSMTAYRSVKVGLNMVMRDWFRILHNDGVQVYSVSPGFLATSLGINDAERLKKMGALDPAKGGNLLREIIEGKHEKLVGKVVGQQGEQPW